MVREAEIDAWLSQARAEGLVSEQGLAEEAVGEEALWFPASVRRQGPLAFALLKVAGQGVLGIFGPGEDSRVFEGVIRNLDAGGVRFCPLNHHNAEALRRLLPYTAPSTLGDKAVTFGLGDRLGVAGAGHLRALRGFKAAPILAQQSVRELELTGRTYQEVLDASTWAVFQEGYTEPWGADGDHLKSEDWVRRALGIGFTRITADVSDYIKGQYALKPIQEVAADYERLKDEYRMRITERYLPLRVELDTGQALTFEVEDLIRIVLMYREAIEHARRLYEAGIREKGGDAFEFELSIDETELPTTPQAHAFIALELQQASIPVFSLAPRFVGQFQKGIDYIGDEEAFERSFRTHAALARKFGYRISVHSGSDKFRIFPLVGRLTRGRFHIKTAGTNWLEAVKVIARLEPGLYRELHQKALKRFDRATRYYHVSTDLSKIPALERLGDEELPGLFDNPHARQLIHITYGELLKETALKKRFFQALERHLEAYWQALQEHIGRHLKLLGVQQEA